MNKDNEIKVLQEFADYVKQEYKNKETDTIVLLEKFIKKKTPGKVYKGKNSIAIEAIQLTYDTLNECESFLSKVPEILSCKLHYNYPLRVPFKLWDCKLEIETFCIKYEVYDSSWICKGSNGGLIIMSDKSFRELFVV